VTSKDDHDVLDRGLALFDSLYAGLSTSGRSA